MGFNLKVNFANVQPWDATKDGFNDVEPGLYEVKTEAADSHKKTIKFHVTGTFGAVDVYIPSDMTKESNARKMKSALLSHGAKEAALNAAGDLDLADTAFVGKKAWLLVTKVDGLDEQNRAKLNDKAFVTPAQAAEWKKAQTAGAANGATGGTAPVNPEGTPAKSNVADLFS